MKLTISCQICGRKILEISKDTDFSDDDLTMYEASCSCEVDGQQTMSNGQPNIMATKTKDE